MGRLGEREREECFIYSYMASDILTYGPFGAEGTSGREREKCFIYGYMASNILTYGPFGADGTYGRERERDVLFNDALNTFSFCFYVPGN